jgi:hypothetical protein
LIAPINEFDAAYGSGAALTISDSSLVIAAWRVLL